MLIRAYTDGACSGNPGPGGWSVVFSLPQGVRCLSGYEIDTTNNRMELTAIIKAFDKILRLGNVSKRSGESLEYMIISDSAYCVDTIKNGRYRYWVANNWVLSSGGPVANADLWSEFVRMRQDARNLKIKIELKKVKGHSGNVLNERADRLAVAERDRAKMEVESWAR